MACRTAARRMAAASRPPWLLHPTLPSTFTHRQQDLRRSHWPRSIIGRQPLHITDHCFAGGLSRKVTCQAHPTPAQLCQPFPSAHTSGSQPPARANTQGSQPATPDMHRPFASCFPALLQQHTVPGTPALGCGMTAHCTGMACTPWRTGRSTSAASAQTCGGCGRRRHRAPTAPACWTAPPCRTAQSTAAGRAPAQVVPLGSAHEPGDVRIHSGVHEGCSGVCISILYESRETIMWLSDWPPSVAARQSTGTPCAQPWPRSLSWLSSGYRHLALHTKARTY